MTLKTGIIGCGGVAWPHAAGYQEHGIEIAAIADLNIDAAESFANNLGYKPTIFPSSKELIDSGIVDMISICTPPVTHAEIAVDALEKGIHVLCEKPLTHNLDDAEKIHSAVKKSDAKFMMAFRHRFLPAIQKMKEHIDNGKIGEPVLFLNEFCGPAFAMKDKWFCRKAVSGGGCMLDTSSHSVDLFRYLIGEVIEQQAVMHKNFQETDVEDCAILTLKSKDGALGSLTSSFVAGSGRARVDITGQGGRLVYEYGEELRYYDLKNKEWENYKVENSGGFDLEIGLFIDSIKNNKEVAVGIEDGIRCLEIILSQYKGAAK